MMLAPCARAQQALPAVPGAQVTQLTPRAGFFSEPSIAINPLHPEQIAAAFQAPAAVSYSQDAGVHWKAAAGVPPANYAQSGDVSITYDILGHAILCYIAFDKLGTPEYWAHNATRNGIYVRRSLDGGKTWDPNAIAVDEQATRPIMPFEDKPYIVADNNPGSPYAGSLYVGWTEFTLTKSAILFSRSNDGGITWSPPNEISTRSGLPRDDNGAVEGFAATVGPDGVVYAVWSDATSIVLASSADGGRTFSSSRKIVDIGPPYFSIENVKRANGFPQIAADQRSGRVYLTWSDYRNGDVDVFCSTSPDRGSTWTRPVRVNDDALHNGADQFFQWLAVDPSDGSANVAFYDRRGDLVNHKATVTLARSTDGGQNFKNYAWMDRAFDAGGQFIGDYTGIAALNGRVYGAWAVVPPQRRARRRSSARAPASPPGTILQAATADFRRPASK
ncbi:MAG TPA: sialidase family protein [Candidatus Acidoferrales bacterium]|nr:sialidase family protein [Candidatus Acidoferrales bacterium]